LEGGDPVVIADEGPQAAIEVDIQVVPDEYQRGIELLVGSDQQIAIVGPGEAASSFALVVGVPLGRKISRERSPVL
jgi:hypothetical protein